MTADKRNRPSIQREAARRAKSAANRPPQPDRRPFPPKRPGEDIGIGTVLGLGPLAQLEEIKKQTHDEVIRATGRRRRSGVSWRIIADREQIEADLVTYYLAEPRAEGPRPDIYAEALAWIGEQTEPCVLVVAMVEVVQ